MVYYQDSIPKQNVFDTRLEAPSPYPLPLWGERDAGRGLTSVECFVVGLVANFFIIHMHFKWFRLGKMALFSSRGAAVLFGVLAPATTVFAIAPSVSIPPASFGPFCAVTGLCTLSFTTGFSSLESFLSGVVVPAIRTIFIGVGILFVAWYALEMIARGWEESALTEGRKAFGYAAIGMGIIGTSSLLTETFAPSTAGTALVSATPFITSMERIADFITVITGAFLVFVISMAGFRIIVLQGNESEIDKQKKNFLHGLMGVPILLLARIIVESILPATGDPNDIVVEIAGIVKFLLEITAGLAIFGLIASGFLLIISLHSDNLRQRAKRILYSTLIILIIIIFSLTIVGMFIPTSTPESELAAPSGLP